MPDSTLTQAIKEAYASAPSNVVIYHTIELRHSTFRDQDNVLQPIRVVRDHANLRAFIEPSDTIAGGSEVTFIGFAFNFTKPEISASGPPQIQLEIDNVDRVILANIERALLTTELVKVVYREYISTDLSGPQNDPPLTLTISSITADVFKITATATFSNLHNKRFPTKEYSAEVFKALA